MKKQMFFAVMILFAVSFPAGAVLNAQEERQSLDVLQIGLWNSVPGNQDAIPVYGLRFGLPFCGGSSAVNGVDFAILGSSSAKVNGFSFAPLFTGAMFSSGVRRGLSVSCVNLDSKLQGVAVGAVNVAGEVEGVQIGAVNYAKKKGLQIGLVNIIPDGFLPVMILFNFKF